MGQNISKPLQGEKPVDFMVRNDKGYWTQPFVDNLTGWSESAGLQIDQYPRFGSFKENDMELMKSINNPNPKGPERINKASKISNYLPSTVKTPPPYDTAIIKKKCSN